MDQVLTLSEIKNIMQKTLYNRYGFLIRDDEIDCLVEQIRKAPAEGTEQANQPDSGE